MTVWGRKEVQYAKEGIVGSYGPKRPVTHTSKKGVVKHKNYHFVYAHEFLTLYYLIVGDISDPKVHPIPLLSWWLVD